MDQLLVIDCSFKLLKWNDFCCLANQLGLKRGKKQTMQKEMRKHLTLPVIEKEFETEDESDTQRNLETEDEKHFRLPQRNLRTICTRGHTGLRLYLSYRLYNLRS